MVASTQGDFFGRMKEKHGKVFKLKIGVGRNIVVVADVDGAETVIRNEGKYPSRGVQIDAMNLIVERHRKRLGLPNKAMSAA